jgi:hypothetical protein
VPENQLIARVVRRANGGRAAGSALVGHSSLPLSRRQFVSALGAATSGAVLGSLVACGGDAPTLPVRRVGRIAGDIVDASGIVQPSLGRVLLMYESGQQTGRMVDVDPAGRFSFADIDPGRWQLRFHAPGAAYVPEQFPHPIRIAVDADRTTDVRITVQRGWEDGVEMMEIYVGDFFFQQQPSGALNGEAVVKIGTPVCWYNVGLMPHTVSGPFWESGQLERTASFIWVPDRTGTFPYTCNLHRSQMIATLRVVT